MQNLDVKPESAARKSSTLSAVRSISSQAWEMSRRCFIGRTLGGHARCRRLDGLPKLGQMEQSAGRPRPPGPASPALPGPGNSRPARGRTIVPRLGRDSTNPLAASDLIASRTTVRLTPITWSHSVHSCGRAGLPASPRPPESGIPDRGRLGRRDFAESGSFPCLSPLTRPVASSYCNTIT